MSETAVFVLMVSRLCATVDCMNVIPQVFVTVFLLISEVWLYI